MLEELLFRVLIVAMWIVFAFVRIFYRRKTARPKRPEDKLPTESREKFGWVQILISISILGMLGSVIVYTLMPLWILWFPLPFPSLVRWVGVILGFSTVPFLVWIHRTLGRFYAPELAIKKEHQLITTGPYSRIRHPMYTVFILFTLSMVLVASNLFVTIFGFLLIIMFYPNSKQEEQMLLNQFGDQYRVYQRQTGRFFPRIRAVSKAKDNGSD
ncbi:MAG: isoprenylcysteine carboxylmethyltransferase family protein [Candidatus Hodarchaeota archaeon]